MSNSIPIIRFLFKNDWPVLSSSLKTNPVYEREEFSTPHDLAIYISGLDAALIISSLMNREDLINIAILLKIQKKLAKDSVAKVVVINFSGDKNFERALSKLGIQDVIDPTISPKPLRYKIDFWMRSLTAKTQKAESSAARSLKSLKSKAPEAHTSDSSIQWGPPLNCVDDFWIIKNDSDGKRILSKKDLVFKKDAHKFNNFKGETKEGADKLKNLQGKGRTEKLSLAPLSVKSTDETSENGKPSSPHSGSTREGQELDLKNKNNTPEKKETAATSSINESSYPESAEAYQTAKVTSIINYESQVIPCELDDYFDRTIIFSAEQEGLKNESIVELDLSFDYRGKETKLKFKGRVVSIDYDDEGKSYISIELTYEHVKSFDTFMKLYHERQKSIELFLKLASGH